MRRHRWFWVLLFIVAMTLVALLATSWNVVLVRNPRFQETPWVSLILGTLGFVGVLTATILFFIRLLREMKLTQLQNEFLAKVSHELKSPITSIELTASLIKQTSPPSPETERLWNLHDLELKRLRTEVEVLLETFRWETRPFRPEKKPLNLEDWLNDSMARWKLLLGENAQVCREGSTLPDNIATDTRLLDLITNNIVDNTRKFKQDTAHLTVRTSIDHPPKGRPYWRIEFEDKGWGFSPEHSRRIFRRFFRSKTGAPYAIGGTGLGLYLASSASKTLGLRLRGQSPGHGKGAKFVIEGELHE